MSQYERLGMAEEPLSQVTTPAPLPPGVTKLAMKLNQDMNDEMTLRLLDKMLKPRWMGQSVMPRRVEARLAPVTTACTNSSASISVFRASPTASQILTNHYTSIEIKIKTTLNLKSIQTKVLSKHLIHTCIHKGQCSFYL